MRRIRAVLATASLLAACLPAHASCIIGAKSKTAVQVLGSHTLLLTGGYGNPLILRSFAFFQQGSQFAVMKDSFCDYDGAALAVDGKPVALQQVETAD